MLKRRLLCFFLAALTAVFYIPSAYALAQTVGYKQTVLGGSVKYFTEKGYSQYQYITGCDSSVTAAYIPNIITISDSKGTYNLTVKGVYKDAFKQNKSLTSLTLGEGITEIQNYAFSECSALEGATLPTTIREIGSYAFSGCTSLEGLIIPNGIGAIGINAFEFCSSLDRLIILDDDCIIGANILFGSNNAVIYCNEGSTAQAYAIENGIAYNIIDDLSSILYDIDNNGAVTGYHGGEAFVDIPEFVGGVKVTAIADKAFVRYINNNPNIYNGYKGSYQIKIPEGVTSIGTDALYDNTALTAVELPSSLKVTGEGAFSGSRNLKSISIPTEIKVIGAYAFLNTSIENITLPQSLTFLGEGAFMNCTSLKNVSINDGLSEISKSAFSGCTSLKEIDFPKSVVKIQSSAFYGCLSISDITIPETLLSVEARAFERCSNLKEAVFLGKSTAIGAFAFKDSSNRLVIRCYESSTAALFASDNNIAVVYFEDPSAADFDFNPQTGEITGYRGAGGSIVLPSAISGVPIKSIGDSAFENCVQIENITFRDGIVSIGNRAFANCKMTQLRIPQSVTFVGAEAFSGCNKLIAIVIPNNLTILSDGIFENCTSLQNVNGMGGASEVILPPSLEKAGNNAFKNCASISMIYANSSLREIGFSAFEECINLTRFTYDGIINIGARAFYKNTLLREFDFSGAARIGDEAFSLCGLTSAQITETTTEIGNGILRNCSNLTDVSFNASVKQVSASMFANCISLRNVELNAEVTEIGAQAFENCRALINILLPTSLVKIGAQAFSGCTLLSDIVFPQTVTEIGELSFKGCSSIKQIELPDMIVEIPASAFSNCSNLKSIDFGSACSIIGERAFENCTSLDKLNIPGDIALINNSAFSNCINLHEIWIHGLATTLGSDVFSGCSVTVYCYSSSTVYNQIKNEPESIYVQLMDPPVPPILEDGEMDISEDGTLLAIGGNPESLEIPKQSADGQIIYAIGAFSLQNLSNLKSLTFAQDSEVKIIGAQSFKGLENLTEVKLPHSLDSIGEQAFANCLSLKEIYLPKYISSISKTAFNGCDIIIGCGVETYAYYYARTTGITCRWTPVKLDVSASEDGMTYSVSNTFYDNEIRIIYAAYASDGSLLEFAVKSARSESASAHTFSENTMEFTSEVKVFAWNSLEGMIPINI